MTYYILRKDGAYAGVLTVGRFIRKAILTRLRFTMVTAGRKSVVSLLKGILARVPAVS